MGKRVSNLLKVYVIEFVVKAPLRLPSYFYVFSRNFYEWPETRRVSQHCTTN